VTALLIGWGVVATLGAAWLLVLWRVAVEDRRLDRASRDQAWRRFWQERQERHASMMEALSEYKALKDDYEALKRAAFPSTASVTETSDDQ
jgi:ABC-type protease/lipase transport system fused ATPase/permease subunit